MNRRTTPIRSSAAKPAAPVLFSLPDVSIPTLPTSSVAAQINTAQTPPPQNTTAPKAPVPLSQTCEPAHSRPVAPQPINTLHTPTNTELSQTPKTNNVLNTAITVLLAATVLIALRIYTLPTQNSDPRTSPPGPNAASLPQPTSTPSNPIPPHNPSTDPTGVVLASSTTPVLTPSLPLNPPPPSAPHTTATSNSLDLTNTEKPTLEIKDPPVSVASYEQAPPIPSPIPSIAANSQGVPQATQTTQPPPATLTLPPNRNKPTIDAQSLNTRDMILLRQGKQLPPPSAPTAPPASLADWKSQPASSSPSTASTPLSGNTYPPIKQKYEPISIPNSSSITSRPTSMEIPPPPKPYQPIGANFE